jgi:hypothetical protein
MFCLQTKKYQFGQFWRALDWKMLMFYGHLEYITAIWYILSPFGIFCVHLVHFFQCWYHVTRKIWQIWQLVKAMRAQLKNHIMVAPSHDPGAESVDEHDLQSEGIGVEEAKDRDLEPIL